VSKQLFSTPALAADPTYEVRCGYDEFWTYWRLNRRPADAGTPSDSLALAYMTAASNPGIAGFGAIQPYGRYEVDLPGMSVFKNGEQGPVLWKLGNHPECY
jgi:phage tail protein X